jgi:solute carrier family 35 protein E1
MGAFQVGGHIFSSMAISRMPVSTVHTIKALSPLFTVAAYALMFGVSYSAKTYISLLPLTIGVMLVCTFDVSGSNIMGLLCAFGSALVFVTSNIFFKKVMPSGTNQTSSHKLDKLNLLFYSSGMAFILMIPIWLYCDLPLLMKAYRDPPEHVAHPGKGHDAPHSVIYYFFLNGSVHFAQNIIAFIILSSTSPVTYSIASLIKRVAVICIAIVWFNQVIHPVQALGIAMTFAGLYMYNQAKGDVEKGENKMRRVEAARDLRLPLTASSTDNLSIVPAPLVTRSTSVTSAHERSRTNPQPATQRSHITNDPVAPQMPERDHPKAAPHSQHHPHPNLHIKIFPPSLSGSPSDLSIDSYPSPPASLDSPPTSAVPLVDQGRYAVNSWISKRSGSLSAMGTTNVMESVRVGVVV